MPAPEAHVACAFGVHVCGVPAVSDASCSSPTGRSCDDLAELRTTILGHVQSMEQGASGPAGSGAPAAATAAATEPEPARQSARTCQIRLRLGDGSQVWFPARIRERQLTPCRGRRRFARRRCTGAVGRRVSASLAAVAAASNCRTGWHRGENYPCEGHLERAARRCSQKTPPFHVRREAPCR
jgi:hypothetical protein